MKFESLYGKISPYVYYIYIRIILGKAKTQMRRTKIARIAVVAISLLLLFSMLISLCTSAIGGNTELATYLNEYSGDLKTSIEQYFNGSVVQKLPSTIKNTDTISIIVDMEMPAIMDAYGESNKTMSMAEFASSSEAIKVMSLAKTEKEAILKSLKDKGIKYTVGATTPQYSVDLNCSLKPVTLMLPVKQLAVAQR